MDHKIRVSIVCLLSVIVLCMSAGLDAKRTYKILEGDNLLVICNVPTNISDLHVYWTKDEKRSSFYQDGRQLEILNINSTASGDYRCHALNTSLPEPWYNETDVNKTIEVITVDVQYAARILSFSVGPYVLMENQSFTVNCNMQGSPGPNWSIRNRDTGNAFMRALHTGGDSSLTSPPARCDYSGYWECTGYNRLNEGVNVTRGHNVTVLCSPRPVYQANNYTVTSFVNREAFLVMELLASPAPNYTWSRDDGSNIPTSVIQRDFKKTTMLQFPSVSIHDFGYYTLKMENQYGAYYAKYQLKGDGQPEAPTNIHASDVTDHSVTLRWTPGYDMGSQQYFLVMKYIDGTSQFTQLSSRIYCQYVNFGINQSCEHTETILFSNTRYNLTIAAKNEHDYLTLSRESVGFTTKENPKAVDKRSESNKERLIVGVVLGSVGTVGLLAFIVYLVKYRKYKTSYEIERKQHIVDKKEETLYGSNKAAC